MQKTDKKCGFFKSIGRYNTGLVAEVAGPVTEFPNLRVKRINRHKGQLLMWERGFYDVILDKSEIQFLRVVGYNFPILKGTNGVTYAVYIDVLIDGKLNRMQVRSLKIPPDAFHSKKYFEGGTPVVLGWIKNPQNPKERDEHFSDPLCPPGYSPLIKEYVDARTSSSALKNSLFDLGISPSVVVDPGYIMDGPYLFDKLETLEEVNTQEEAASSPAPEAPSAPEQTFAANEEAPSAPEKEENSAPAGGKYAELLELKKLLDAGIISQSDYEAKKAEVLGISSKKSGSGKGNKVLKILDIIAISVSIILLINSICWRLLPPYAYQTGWEFMRSYSSDYQQWTFFEAVFSGHALAILSFAAYVSLIVIYTLYFVFIFKRNKAAKIVLISLAFLLELFLLLSSFISGANGLTYWVGTLLCGIFSSTSLLFVCCMLGFSIAQKK